MLIIGPGGLFPFDNPSKVAIYFFTTLLWKVFGRKVAFFGVGISERMGSFSKAIWRATAAISDLFITRSPAVVEKIGCIESPKIHTMADTVFASSMRFKNSCCEDIIRIVFSDLVVVSTVKLIFKETVANSWMSFIGNVILIGIIGLFIYLICVFDKSERSRILALIHSLDEEKL